MKKVLYGSTALVAAGAMAAAPAAAEEGIELGLGGYYNSFFWVSDYDEANGDPRDLGSTGVYADGEVHFKGKTTLDNGITFGVQIELEAFQSGDQIDENYAFIEGSFGRLIIGGENTVGYMMQYAAPSVGAPINSGWVTAFIPPAVGTTMNTAAMGTVTTTAITTMGAVVTMTAMTTGTTTMTATSTTGFRTPGISTYVDLMNDDHALNYYSPRFSGFQVGVSYVPAATVNGEGKNFPVYADKNTEVHDLVAVGANYVQSFDGFDIALAGGYRRAEDDTGNKDPEQWSAGINLGMAGFTIGGSIAIEDSDRRFDGTAFDVGASYGTGPWAVGVQYFASEVEGAVNDGAEDEFQAAKAGVSYAVGPGITASATLMWAEWDGEAGNDADGVAGVFGFKMGF